MGDLDPTECSLLVRGKVTIFGKARTVRPFQNLDRALSGRVVCACKVNPFLVANVPGHTDDKHTTGQML